MKYNFVHRYNERVNYINFIFYLNALYSLGYLFLQVARCDKHKQTNNFVWLRSTNIRNVGSTTSSLKSAFLSSFRLKASITRNLQNFHHEQMHNDLKVISTKNTSFYQTRVEMFTRTQAQIQEICRSCPIPSNKALNRSISWPRLKQNREIYVYILAAKKGVIVKTEG